jgi:hypothetical protein
MKNLLLILLVFIAAMSTNDVKAQNATGGASDHRVPVPVATPQIRAIGVNTAPLNVPTAPPLQVIAPSIVAQTPTITGPTLLPDAPAPPRAPAPGLRGSPAAAKTLALPKTPVLPPIPPLPSMPDVRVAIGTN